VVDLAVVLVEGEEQEGQRDTAHLPCGTRVSGASTAENAPIRSPTSSGA
jgi:hypothetical protein